MDQLARTGANEMPELPRGTVTFLFTDIEGSTRLVARLGDAYTGVLLDQREILRAAFDRWQGVEVDTQGDSFFVAFARTSQAVSCALDIQRALERHEWPEGVPVRVRMAIHAGEALVVASGYVGIEVNRAARIMAAAHGGQVLLSESASALTHDQLPEGATLVELGEHRLRDLDRAERLFQLAHRDLPAEFPPLRTPDYRPNNLPVPVSAFVGRQSELGEIAERFARASIRLITLTGPGGTGKTRLALHAAADQLEHISDGVYFIDLAPVTDTESALAAIARVVGLTQGREEPVLEALKKRLHDRPVLLVLDNFEQVTTAAGSIAELLEACPALRVLVTSREALHIRGEHLFPVSPMSLPPVVSTHRTAEEIGHFEAIQLFVERARAVRPSFHLTDDNAAAVVEICRRLDGLPLAIELATARINLFSPEVLRDRLTSRLATLDAGARDLPIRQQTLRATIDWSYRLLGPGEQRLFELLSVFAGIGIEAVEQVANEAGLSAESGLAPLDGLASLLEKSLLRPTETGDGRDGLVMLETIREYAAERLAERPELADVARRAHSMYFTSWAQRYLSQASGPEGEQAMAAMAVEIENLRIAWRFWVASNDLQQLNELVESLWLVYQAEGRLTSIAELMTELLDVLATTPSTAERALQEVTLRTRHARALMAIKGYTAEVEEAYARALELFEGQRNDPQIFPVLRDLARFYIGGADFQRAAVIGQELLRLGESQGDPGILLDGHLIVATAFMEAGDLEAAVVHLDRAIEASEAPDFGARRFSLGPDPRVSTLTTSGFMLWLLGYPDRALERADRGVALGATLDPYSLAYGLFHNAFLHLWRSEPHLVLERALQLLDLVADHDFPIWRALGTCLAGAANAMLGHPEEGLAQFREGMDQYQGMRSPPVFWPFLRIVEAATLATAGRTADALTVLDEAVPLVGDRAPGGLIHIIRGDVLLATGEVGGSAEESYERSRQMGRRLGAPMIQLQAEMRLLRLRRARGKIDDGSALRAVYETFTEGFATRDLSEARELLAGSA